MVMKGNELSKEFSVIVTPIVAAVLFWSDVEVEIALTYYIVKPEEVLIVEDENGNIVRETMKDNDVLVQYKVFNLYLKNKASNLYIYICQSVGIV